MSGTRGSLIRIAHAHPELRPHLLPLLKQPASGKTAGGVVSLECLLGRELVDAAVSELQETTNGHRILEQLGPDDYRYFVAKALDSLMMHEANQLVDLVRKLKVQLDRTMGNLAAARL